MNKGAKFYKCDFQVHSPRDLQFKGKECATQTECEEYAQKFIKACREKGVYAVAITDHHDLVFYQYIKQAAKNEIDENGELFADDERIIIFPGIELTLDVPCQALLIFDAFMDIDLSLRVKIYTALSISDFTSEDESKTAYTSRLPIKDINEVIERLNSIPELKDKFILLPNVSDNGSCTIFRQGLQNQYKNGQFIAGYLDGNTYEKNYAKQGWRNKVFGVAKEYGNRSIAVIQTSDNRTETFENLGIGHTWIKFLEPTAEGLRQSFLAKSSRISQTTPKLPSVYIDKLEISDSSFLKNVDLDFTPQLNVLIGGRGTGKSSVLLYIMFALGKKENRIIKFIKDTISNGFVLLTVVQNGVVCLIKRSLTEHSLKIADNPWESTDKSIIEQIIQIDAYTQKELSEHKSDRVELVNHLVSFSIRAELEKINNGLEDNKNQINETFSKYQTILTTRKRLKEQNSRKASLDKQIEELNKNLIGSKSDQEIIERQKIIENEKRYVESLTNKYSTTFQEVKTFYDELNLDLPNPNFSPVNANEITELKNFVEAGLEGLRAKLEELVKSKDEITLSSKINSVAEKQINQTSEYIESKSRMEESAEAVGKIEASQKEIGFIDEEIARLNESLNKNVGIEVKLYRLFDKRFSLANKEFKLKFEEANRLSTKSEGGLEIKLVNFTDINKIIEAFNEKVRGARGSSERVNDFFIDLIKSKVGLKISLLKLWFVIFICKREEDRNFDDELRRFRIKNNSLTEADLNRIKTSITEGDLLELALMLPSYKPEMAYYRSNKPDDKIPFSNASYGQQAGAILNILLNQTHGSLIIDQPEEDLDNKVIHQITERIGATKENRQLIFTSHNANIVVNGDAELIIHLEHNDDKSAGEIKTVGTIDTEEVRTVIKSVMEGGEDAFQLRAKKYNFSY
jgi:type III restriction enzyme